MNRNMTTGAPELHPILVKSPWHQIGIDFVGPVSPDADDRSRYILTVSDYFKKWVEAVPTADKSASSVAAVLFKVGVCNTCTCRYVQHGMYVVQSRQLLKVGTPSLSYFACFLKRVCSISS